MSTCITCKTTETKTGICCPTCGSILNVMVVIKKHWDLDELTKLRDTLRDEPVITAHTQAKNRGASVMAKLLWFIIELARPLKIHPDAFRVLIHLQTIAAPLDRVLIFLKWVLLMVWVVPSGLVLLVAFIGSFG